MDKMDNQELISALADGQLQGDAFARAVQAASGPEGRRAWEAYHLVGEVLRTGQAVPARTSSEAFLQRLRGQLQQEELARPRVPQQPLAVPLAPARQAAANDMGWKIAAGLASVAAVVAIGWNLVGAGAGGAGAAGPQLAVAPASSAPAEAAMLRDARLDQLLAAHRQLGGASALQTPSGFLRNATFEGPAR